MKLNIELKDMELNEANVVLAALRALNGSVTPVIQTETVPTEVSAVSESTPDVDAEGLKWDSRIHSSNRKMNDNGRWQRRKNITDEFYDAVKAQILGTEKKDEGVIPPLPVPEVVVPEVPVAEAPAPAPVEPVAPVQAPVVEPVQVPVEPEQTPAAMYMEMFAKLQAGFQAKKIDANYIQNTVKNLNTMFNKNWTGLAEIKEDKEAMKVVIDELTKAGM